MTTAASNTPNTWWLILLQGIAVLILGLLLITNTGMTVVTLIIFLGVYWLIDGIFSIIRIFTGHRGDLHWGWLLFRGILGILAGIMVVRHPLIGAILIPTTVVFIIGIQGAIMGFIGLFHAFKGGGWGMAVLSGLNVIFGMILLFNPLVGAVILPTIAGLFGIIGGISLIVLSFQARSA